MPLKTGYGNLEKKVSSSLKKSKKKNRKKNFSAQMSKVRKIMAKS